jgi:NAD(P)-dependent dehydrogenase (short-subunit alcohol dehydrogenase family)
VTDYQNKVAIVTGGASGIGRAIAEDLARNGARVVVTDLNAEGGQQVAAAIQKLGDQAEAAPLDVTNAAAVQALVSETVARHGRLDFMFNNAGIGVGGEVRDLSLEHWRRIIDVNLWGVIHGVAAAYPVMVKQGFGHLVNTASLAGLIPSPMATPYATTKMAVVGLSLSLRAEAVALGVKVSAICPGFVQSGIYEAATVINVKNEDIIKAIPVKIIAARRAAMIILRGVARNKAIITFPFYARLLWRLHRLHAGLLDPIARKAIKDFRAMRVEPTAMQLSLNEPKNGTTDEHR